MPRRIFLALLFAGLASFANAQSPKTGVVIMHGKGGLPDGSVLYLAEFLQSRGDLVANLEMPWSSRRDYDVDSAAALKQVADALDELRAKGATKVFVAGHSQGGGFALYVGGRLSVDGVIAIAPGGNVATPIFRQTVRESLERAEQLVAAGKGAQRERFVDYEGSRGVTPLITNAAAYASWFDPNGAMNQVKSEKSLPSSVPVLYVAPTDDYPGLVKAKRAMFDALPKNPLTKLYEPDSNHMRAPIAAREEIARWIGEVASR